MIAPRERSTPVPRPVLTVTPNAALDVTMTVAALQPGTPYTVRQVLKLPGGKGLNVARSLRGLGVPVVASGFAGGPMAPVIVDGLEREGIAARFQPIAGASRTCNAVVEDSGRVTELNEPGPEIAPDEAADFLDLFGDLVAGASVACLSGSLPPGLPDDYYASLAVRARAQGVPVVLDTSGRALGPGLAAAPLLAKPNAKEAGVLLGTEVRTVDEAVRAGRLLQGHGALLAAITLGGDGAVLVGPSGAWHAQAHVEHPVSPVGSGDAFTGGLVGALWAAVDAGACRTIEEAAGRDDVLIRALTQAVACGAANTLMLGAARMAQADVAALRGAATVERIG